MLAHRISALAGSAVLCLGISTAALAQSRPYGDDQQGLQAYRPPVVAPNNPYSDYPAAEVQAVPAARARAAIARMELLRSHVELNRGTVAAVEAFNQSEEMSKAKAAEDEAYAAYRQARERALMPLADDGRYQTMSELRGRLAEQLADKHAEYKPKLNEIFALAGLKLQYSMDMTLREVALLRDSSEVREARERLMSASRNTASLRAQFKTELREDPDLVAARRAVFDSKVAHVAASVYLRELRTARGIALDYAYWVRRYNPYQVFGYDPYGFNPRSYAYGGGYRY